MLSMLLWLISGIFLASGQVIVQPTDTSLVTAVNNTNGAVSERLTLPGGVEINMPTLPNLLTSNLKPLFETPCFGLSDLKQGVCKSAKECDATGGRQDGPCALNLGVCCTKPSSCGAKPVLANVSVWANTGYPEPQTTSELCTMTIAKLPGVAQIRVDFEDFNVGSVDESGRCSVDAMVFEGLNPKFGAPRLCGSLKGQHIYLPVDKTPIGAQVTIRLVFSPTAAPRLFRLRITQIPLISDLQAPPGCLQYITEPSGIINSFNFESTKNVGIRNIHGLSYAICFRRSAGMCSIQFDPVFLRTARSYRPSIYGVVREYDPLAPGRYPAAGAPYAQAQPRPQYRPAPARPVYSAPVAPQRYAAPAAPRPPVYRHPVPRPAGHPYRKSNVYSPVYKRPFVQQRPRVYQKPVIYYKPTYETTPLPEKKEIIKELIDLKTDLLAGLIEEKTRIVNNLLNGSGLVVPGVGLPAVPLPALPVLKPLPALTDDSLRKFLPVLPKTGGLGTLGGPRLRGAPVDITSSLVCAGKDSIGFPPGAILCAENSRSVILSTAPFMIFVDNRGSIPGRGFSFQYRQQICS